MLVENADLTLAVAGCVLGPLYLNGESTASLSDTILDASDPTAVAIVASIGVGLAPVVSGALTMNGCTVIGKVYASLLSLASNCLFIAALSEADISSAPRLWNAPLWSARRQQGCVRFSYVPTGEDPAPSVPLRGAGAGRARSDVLRAPVRRPCIRQIAAHDRHVDSPGRGRRQQIGAFHPVLAPQREADLLTRLAEYVPVGLEYGIFYEN